MNSNIRENFAITEDGTIKRPYDLEASILNIIRVAASKDNLLAAYDARKSCYKLCKRAGCPNPINYVETLQLDNYPLEFKKAEYGRRYVRSLWWLIVTAILSVGGFILGIATIVDWDEVFIGVLLIVIAIALLFVIKLLANRIKTERHQIRDVK